MKDMKIMKWDRTESRPGLSPAGRRPAERGMGALNGEDPFRLLLHVLHALHGE